MLRGQLNRQAPDLKVDKRYLDQLKGVSPDDLENDVKVNLASLPYDSMTAPISGIPRIMKTEWIPIDYAALGL